MFCAALIQTFLKVLCAPLDVCKTNAWSDALKFMFRLMEWMSGVEMRSMSRRLLLLLLHNSFGDLSEFGLFISFFLGSYVFELSCQWFSALRRHRRRRLRLDLSQHNSDFISQTSSHRPRLSRGAWLAFRLKGKRVIIVSFSRLIQPLTACVLCTKEQTRL